MKSPASTLLGATRLLGAILALLPPGARTADAQPFVGAGSFVWEVSDDGGTTWTGGEVAVAQHQPDVLVRAVASWSLDAGYALTGVQFDVAITGPAGHADGSDGYSRGPFNTGVRQTIAGSRFGDVIKIDDDRDTLPPGAGPRGVYPSQLTPQFGNILNPANPATVFTFRLLLDGSLGPRSIEARFVPPLAGNSTDRFLMLYTDEWGGSLNLPRMSYTGASVRVIPTPWPLGVLLGPLCAAWAGRRREMEHSVGAA